MGIQAALSGDLPLQLQGRFYGGGCLGAGRQGVAVYRRGRQPSGLHFDGASFDQAPRRSQGERESALASSGRAPISSPGWPRGGLGLTPDKDVQIVGTGGQGDRWTALTAGQFRRRCSNLRLRQGTQSGSTAINRFFERRIFEDVIVGPVTMPSFHPCGKRDSHELHARVGGRDGFLL